MTIIQGNCLDILKTYSDNHFTTIITDPPYGLSFMGKKWDYNVPSIEIWKECLRVLKHGGTMLCFAGSRTQHRMAVNVEDAGFVIKDCLMWLYGSGFPKSLNIGKANKDYEGYGTALKPAYEPILFAMKPNEGSYANNAIKRGVAGINIDKSRIVHNELIKITKRTNETAFFGSALASPSNPIADPKGRFPSNILLDEVSAEMLDEQSGELSKATLRDWNNTYNSNEVLKHGLKPVKITGGRADKGGASRFFYCAKASKAERNAGLDRYLTVKHNISKKEGVLCEENTVVVQLLQKVISEQELVSFSIDESGENIMVRCHKGCLSIILTEINKIIESKILNLLMLSLTNESIQDVKLEMVNGLNLVENVEILKTWIVNITKGNLELALGASNVALQMLLKIRNAEEWKEVTNFHATVKPIKLMEYLINLVMPPANGLLLDPFAGSGSTIVSAINLGYSAVGIELDKDYCGIAKSRIANELNKYKQMRL